MRGCSRGRSLAKKQHWIRHVAACWRTLRKEERFMDDVLLNKAATIERCVARAREEYAANPAVFLQNVVSEDSFSAAESTLWNNSGKSAIFYSYIYSYMNSICAR